jgi:hypothetical protein
MNKFAEILKQVDESVISEETAKAITEAFESAVEEKVNARFTLEMESALSKQDEDHATKLQKLLEGSDSVPHFRFAGQTDDEEDRQAYWNELLKRWEIRVVIITPNNEIEDYGFNPSEPDEPIDEDLINQIKSKVPTVKITEPTPSGDKEVELEKAKAETKKAEAEIEKAKAEQEKAKAEDTKLKAQMKVIELFAEGKISEKKMDELLAKFK